MSLILALVGGTSQMQPAQASPTATEGGTGTTAAAVQGLAPTPTPTDAAPVPAAPAAAPARDVFVFFNMVKQDGGFNAMAYDAARDAEERGEVRVRTRVTADNNVVEQAVTAFAKRDGGHVVFVSNSYEPVVERLSDRHPHLRFTIIDSALDRPNTEAIQFREDEASYLAGMAAALTVETGRFGFIGGMPIDAVTRFGCGFIQGILSIRPEAEIDGIYLSNWVDGFRDVDRARRTAGNMVDRGAGVILVAAGLAGTGALEEIAVRGRFGIGVDTNQNGLFPGHILTSVVKRVDMEVARVLREAGTPEFRSGVRRAGLAEGAVDIVIDEYNRARLAPVMDRIDAARRDIMSGALAVLPARQVPACTPLLQGPRS
ncbi:MAG: hypothetical protein RLY86_1217 [Pseudomonadota bacterium]|jgi:basic membrane protein A